MPTRATKSATVRSRRWRSRRAVSARYAALASAADSGPAPPTAGSLRLISPSRRPRADASASLHRPPRPRTLGPPAPCQPRRALCIVARRMAAYSVGIDVGGTFTDCFVTDGAHGWRGTAPPPPPAAPRRPPAAPPDPAAAARGPPAPALGPTARLAL